jgi:hypothetical protein
MSNPPAPQVSSYLSMAAPTRHVDLFRRHHSNSAASLVLLTGRTDAGCDPPDQRKRLLHGQGAPATYAHLAPISMAACNLRFRRQEFGRTATPAPVQMPSMVLLVAGLV